MVDSLRARVERLEFQDFATALDSVALLKPSDDGYSKLKTDFGLITVSIKNVEPYADGSRLRLTFGNTTAASLSGVGYTVEWGRVNDEGLPIEEAKRSKEVKADGQFRSGSWNSATITLEQTPPSEVGFVRIKDFHNSGILLTVSR